MRRLFHIYVALAFLAVSAHAAEAPQFDFRMEFSKREIFVGEQVLCNFVLYTPSELIDVEVAKFAEFRGFWKENLVLRQGPISTLFGLGRGPNSATIGSYQLIPMVGAQERVFEPMKVVVRLPGMRRMEGSIPPEIALSQGPELKIKELPPPPSGTPWNRFGGAVGRFNSFSGDPVIPFQKREPSQLRLTLQGQGNFQEINQIVPNFPEGVSVISSKSYIVGNGIFGSKTFETVITVDRDKDFDLEPITFVYFDPEVERYQVLSTPPIRFVHQAATAEQMQAEGPLALRPLHKTWKARKPIEASPWFWAGNLFAAVVALNLGLSRRRRRKTSPPRVSARKHRRQLIARAELLAQSGEIKPFLSLAHELVVQSLRERAGLDQKGITAKRLLQLSKATLDIHTFQETVKIISTYEEVLFSPKAAPRIETESLVKALKRVVG